jgi:hypothetical protein
MQTSRFTDSEIMAILKQAEACMLAPELAVNMAFAYLAALNCSLSIS